MNRDEYEKANEDDKRNYHGRKFNSYRTQLKSLQKNEVVNEDSPMYKEMIRLQELFRFHLRQYNRIRTKNKMETFYSLELETNRKKCKGQMTPQGNPMPYQEISQELYETLSKENKIKYHSSLKENKDLDTIFHARLSIVRFKSAISLKDQFLANTFSFIISFILSSPCYFFLL